MKPKIGIITHYSGFKKQFSGLGDEMGCELQFHTGVLDYAISIAVNMEKNDGVDVIISHEKTSETIAPYVGVPVLPLHTKDFNLISAFYNCRQMGDRIAFVDFEKDTLHYDFDRIKKILGYDILWYKFNDLKKLPELLDQISRDRRNVIATTASCMYGYAKSRSLSVALIQHQKLDLVAVVRHAMDMLRIKNKEEEKFHWLSAVMDNTSDGFITLDRDGAVTGANAAAQNALDFSAQDVIGRRGQALQELNPALEAIIQSGKGIDVISGSSQDQDQDLVVVRQDILSGDTLLGSILKIEALKNIQRVEMHARKKASFTGFIATNTFDDIIGVSKAIQRVKEQARSYANIHSNILITGESGVGKEMFAQSIHNHSQWRNGPFVALNCAALPENLLDSELFGYEDGAFTGAKKGGKAGLFELAHGGTFFLDEIGEMPPILQAKILRALQEKEVRRIGGSRNKPISVRFIFATNRNLYEAVLNKTFREDLYYRVNVLNLTIPPLRERIEDVRPIAAHLAASYSAAHSRRIAFTPGQLDSLTRYDWPGNVRELQNVAERILAVSSRAHPDDELVGAILDEIISSAGGAASKNRAAADPDSGSLFVPIGTMHEMENHIIAALYRLYQGDKKRLGCTLDLCNTTLWRRLKETESDAAAP